MGERIQWRLGEVWLDDDLGIVRITALPNATITLDDAKEEMAAIRRVSGGERRPLLVDIRTSYINADAREYYGSDESRATWRAVALLSSNPQATAVSTMWAAAYDHQDAPSRVYFAEAPAIEWLRGFVGK